VRAVAVGLCLPAEARMVCGRRAPSVRCLCDRSKAAYAAYGLADGSLAQVMYGPEVVAGYARAALQGHFARPASSNDIWRMLPGTFAIDATGTVRAAHYARHAGDQPDLGTMLSALRRA
jgi:hypothetical protein